MQEGNCSCLVITIIESSSDSILPSRQYSQTSFLPGSTMYRGKATQNLCQSSIRLDVAYALFRLPLLIFLRTFLDVWSILFTEGFGEIREYFPYPEHIVNKVVSHTQIFGHQPLTMDIPRRSIASHVIHPRSRGSEVFWNSGRMALVCAEPATPTVPSQQSSLLEAARAVLSSPIAPLPRASRAPDAYSCAASPAVDVSVSRSFRLSSPLSIAAAHKTFPHIHCHLLVLPRSIRSRRPLDLL